MDAIVESIKHALETSFVKFLVEKLSSTATTECSINERVLSECITEWCRTSLTSLPRQFDDSVDSNKPTREDSDNAAMFLLQKTMVKRMIHRRGYASDDDVVSDDVDFVDRGSYWIYKPTPRVIVFFVYHTKVTIDTIKAIIKSLSGKEELIFLIHAKPLTSGAEHIISNLNKIELFTFDEMSFDLISIVPAHSLVVFDDESTSNKFHEWDKLPVILASDIVARYYGFKRGDIVRITEDDIVTYRRCV